MLKRQSIKRSAAAALFIGIMIPLIVWRFFAVDAFITLDFLRKHLLVTCISVISVFMMFFVLFWREYRCPHCSKSWVYDCVEDDLLSLDFMSNIKRVFFVYFRYCVETHLEEYMCSSCRYNHNKKVTRRFFKLEKNNAKI